MIDLRSRANTKPSRNKIICGFVGVKGFIGPNSSSEVSSDVDCFSFASTLWNNGIARQKLRFE